MAEPKDKPRVPLNPGQFLNVDDLSIRRSNAEMVRRSSLSNSTAFPEVHVSGKTVKKIKAKKVSWKTTDAHEVGVTEKKSEASQVISPPSCLVKSKEIVDNSSQIFDDLDWSKYLVSRSRRKIKLNQDSSLDTTKPLLEHPALTKCKISKSAAAFDKPPEAAAFENPPLIKSKISEPEAFQNPPLIKSKIAESEALENPSVGCTQMDFSSTHAFHHTNPFFTDGEFNHPLPLYREKLLHSSDSYYHVQDGGEGLNPFLDFNKPDTAVIERFKPKTAIVADFVQRDSEIAPDLIQWDSEITDKSAIADSIKPDSPVTESARALCATLIQGSNDELDQEESKHDAEGCDSYYDFKKLKQKYEASLQLTAAAAFQIPVATPAAASVQVPVATPATAAFQIPVASLESSWAWNHLYPPDTPSSYFPDGDMEKVYRNRRTNSAQSAVGTLSSPKFLAELRPSLSSISLVPAVFSEQSLPSDSGSRNSSYHSRSTSDDQYADSEREDEKPKKVKKKKVVRKHKGQERRVLHATSDLGARIIDILNSYSHVEDMPDHIDLLLRNLPPSPSTSADQTAWTPNPSPQQSPSHQKKPDRSSSLPSQKTKLRVPPVLPKARPSQLISINNRKKSVTNATESSRVRPLKGVAKAPVHEPRPKRDFMKENKDMIQYRPLVSVNPGVILGRKRSESYSYVTMYDQYVNSLGKATATSRQSCASLIPKLQSRTEIKIKKQASTPRLPGKKKSGH